MDLIYTLPFKGRNRITSPYGHRTLNGADDFHRGLDIVGDDDKTVHAVIGGTVKCSTIVTNHTDSTWEWGNFVKVQGDDGRSWFYCHLASRAVTVGQRVEAGDVLGIMGNTGYSFGAHTHLEVRDAAGSSLDPSELLGLPDAAGVTWDSAAMETAYIGTLECLTASYRWRTGPGTHCALHKPASTGRCMYCRPGAVYRVYATATENGVLWCQITPPASCITKGGAPQLWVSAECGGHLARSAQAAPAVDWQSACNEFIVSATGADRARLRALCESLCLPVQNA